MSFIMEKLFAHYLVFKLMFHKMLKPTIVKTLPEAYQTVNEINDNVWKLQKQGDVVCTCTPSDAFSSSTHHNLSLAGARKK